MKQPSFPVAVFAAVLLVFLCSGQQRRPAATVPPSQRPPASTRQKAQPATHSDAERSAVEMPPLFWLPEDVQFPEMPQGSPRTVTLLGNPKAEGLYVTRTFIPKGKQIIPHSHVDSRTVVVLSGTCYYGLGEEFDESHLVALPPGSFFTEPAGVPHFTWAKEGDVVLQTTAMGPSGTQIVPDKKSDAVPKKP